MGIMVRRLRIRSTARSRTRMLPLRATGVAVGITGMTSIVLPLGITMAATIADIIIAGNATMVVTIKEVIATAEGASSAAARSWVVDRAVTAACRAVGPKPADCHRLRLAAFHLHGQDQERIRRRAYQIWEREGRPEGRHEQHWAQACQEIAAESGTSTAPE